MSLGDRVRLREAEIAEEKKAKEEKIKIVEKLKEHSDFKHLAPRLDLMSKELRIESYKDCEEVTDPKVN